MSGKYVHDEDCKRTLADLYRNGTKQSFPRKEYGMSSSALSRWTKQNSIVTTGDDQMLTGLQIKERQKRNAQLEEENLILKKRLPSSRHTQTKLSLH